MHFAMIPVSLAAFVAACGPLSAPPDTASLPPGVFGPSDQDVPATQYAENAFADAARTYGNPMIAAQAVLAMDYIAGQLNTSPRWANIPADTKVELLNGRAETRAAVGIAPNAPSQLVIDSLVAARNDLAVGNKDAAIAALTNSAFPAGGARTIELLSNLPYIQLANLSTLHASTALDNQEVKPDAFAE
ncbi:hypothetical protein [Acidisphaera sp. L21]|jgi:hypothetical protein|uniref:hypothetical protein n=1 Tax=Acidisphaera sp. L21 TaxID=1641851 RepID=UPI00131D27CA|nr:hypothetical protein [Acidisphaera sp. L21]